MATIGNTYLNLIDMYRSAGEEESATLVEMLSENSPAFIDGVFVECNDGTRHKHSIRTSLPEVTWGRLYKGITQSKSTKAQVADVTGFVEGLSSVDERLLEISPNAKAERLSEANAFIESMTQDAETGIFYYNEATSPEKFTGLAARYDSLTGWFGSAQVVDGGGSGNDLTSIWGVTWGEGQTVLLHPKGTKAGIQRTDMGRQRVLDSDNKPFYVQEELFRLHLGLGVRDPRYNFRIANIDVSDVQAGNVDLYALLRSAYYRLHSVRATPSMKDPNAARSGRTVIYMNRDIAEALDALATNSGANDSFVRLRPMELEGKEVQSYRGIPIRITDALLNTEDAVS